MKPFNRVWSRTGCRRRDRSHSALGILTIVVTSSLFASPSNAQSISEVSYPNPEDGIELTATLVRPAEEGPHPGVVLLSIAGTAPVVERLGEEGFAVLMPMRRGFVAVEPLLQASYADLAGDVRAALAFMTTLPEIDERAVAVVAQADDAPPALLAMVSVAYPVPLVLLAPPAFPGVEEFRREQRWMASQERATPEELSQLDAYVDQMAEIARGPEAPYVREYRLASLRTRSSVDLPRNAAFPQDGRQAHFFASPLWKDRLNFEPEVELGRVRSPVLVVIGTDDANTPTADYLDAIGRGLAVAPSADTSVCLVEGRTRHTFTEQVSRVLIEWLAARVPPDRAALEPRRSPAACLAGPGP